MAVLIATKPLNMETQDANSGTVTEANDSTIQIEAGNTVTTYEGSFTYGSNANVFGTLFSITEATNGTEDYTIAEINRDAHTFTELLYDGDIEAVYALIFGGDDTFKGSSAGDRLYGYDGADKMLGNGGSDKILGGNGADLLKGGDGNDKLFGGAGADKIFSGLGIDAMKGGSHADKFVFSTVEDSGRANSADTIWDFDGTTDKIGLGSIDAQVSVTGDQAFHFVGSASFSGEEGELRYSQGVVLGDTDGDGVADFAIKIGNGVELDKGDFIL